MNGVMTCTISHDLAVRAEITDDQVYQLEHDKGYRSDFLAHCILDAEKAVIGAAIALAMMINNGDEIPKHIPGSLVKLLLRIADGSVIPDVYIDFVRNPRFMHRVASLPMADQKKIISSKSFDVVVVNEDGRYTTRQIPVDELTPFQQKIVIGDDGIRSDREQIAFIESMAMRDKWRHEKPAAAGIEVNVRKGQIIINEPTILTRKDLANYMSQLA